MLATACHSPAWRNQGYVCLACRRQQVRVHRQQRRWNSEIHHTSTSAGSDSWFDTLNDISDSFGESAPPKPKPQPKAKSAKKHALKERTDPFTESRENLSTTVDSPRSAGNLTIAKLSSTVKELKQRRSDTHTTRPSHHWAKRRQRRASRETAQDANASGSTAQQIGKEEGGTASINGLVQQLKNLQQEKAAEDDERLSWTKEAHNLMDTSVKEESTEDDAVTKADATEPRPFPAFSVVKAANTHRSFRPSPAVDDVAVPQGTTSKSRTRSQATATTTAESAGGTVNIYKARTSPAASGLGGPLVEEPQARSLQARWRKQQKQLNPFGVRKEESGQGTSGVSFDSLRSADKVSDETITASKHNSTPFGLGFASLRKLAFESSKAEASQSAEAQSAGKSKEDVQPRGKGNDMNSLLAALKAQDHKAEEVPIVVEAETQPDLEPESPPEGTTIERSDLGGAKAHERLNSLYQIRYSSPRDHDPRKYSQKSNGRRLMPDSGKLVEQERHTTAAAAVRNFNDESPMPAGQSIADAMKDDRDGKQTSGSAPPQSPPPDADPPEEHQSSSEQIVCLNPSSIEIKPLDIPQPNVPYLEYGLDRVLFNPGVYQLQDPVSRVYNFDPYLQNIMPVNDFDFNSLKEYKTSSQDQALSALAIKEGKRYIGSTSSMTSSLAHFHYLLSNFRPVNTAMYSREFAPINPPKDTFTEINRAPSSIFLRWKNGTYAIDADKEYDSGNVLMLLGKSMELLLTMPKDDYERYRKSDPRQVSEEQRTSPESYQYTTMRDFLMRSQLDAYDPRLPGNGTFDLKTRAVVSVRMSASDYEPMTGYEIFNLQGKWGSYEREYYDMTRSTMLKYMLQARMGRMNGIFVAYHNVSRIFGFQYIPMHDMDRALHGQTDSCLGNQEFKASLDIMNEIFNKATAKFSNQSLRFHFETQPERGDMPTALHVFAEPMAEKDIDAIQNSQKEKIAAFERDIMGKEDEPAAEEDNQRQFLDADAGNGVEVESSRLATDADANSEANNDEVAVEEKAPVVHSTEAPADRAFLDSIGAKDEELGPLFYATVIVQSKVDGEYLEADRPTDLKKNQKWEIDYILKEYETTRHQWALYEDSKARRRHALYNGSDDDADVDAETDGRGRYVGFNSYIKFLRQMSDRGTEIREKIDRMDAGKEVIRVEKPLSREREKIESLEDYMSWMYRAKDV